MQTARSSGKIAKLATMHLGSPIERACLLLDRAVSHTWYKKSSWANSHIQSECPPNIK